MRADNVNDTLHEHRLSTAIKRQIRVKNQFKSTVALAKCFEALQKQRAKKTSKSHPSDLSLTAPRRYFRCGSCDVCVPMVT